jgi:hypothetical protein
LKPSQTPNMEPTSSDVRKRVTNRTEVVSMILSYGDVVAWALRKV